MSMPWPDSSENGANVLYGAYSITWHFGWCPVQFTSTIVFGYCITFCACSPDFTKMAVNIVITAIVQSSFVINLSGYSVPTDLP